jgi:hypothetical protein
MNCLRSRWCRDRGFESHSRHGCLMSVLCLCTGRGLATSWSPVEWVLPTFLDLVTEVKRKVSWRRPRPKLGCRAKGKILSVIISRSYYLWVSNKSSQQIYFFCSTALCWALDAYFQFFDITQAAGLLGRGTSPSQCLYLNTGQHKHRIYTYIHTKLPCPELVSNLRSQRPSEQRQFMA